MRSAKHTKKKRTWLKVTGIVLLILLIGGGAYAYSIYHSLNKAVETMHTPSERETSKRTKDVEYSSKDPISVLLMGVDEREGDKGRSDTMIVLTVNPELKSVKMLSIPRDTLTDIVGHGTRDKINHAYAFGGVEMAMDTVENLMDIPIDHYVKINMEGFQEIVDAVGGVTVENDLDFSSGGYDFAQGEITLSGKKALAYTRMRYEDPRGDFGRQERQRQIIQGIIREGASVSSLWKFDDIFDALGNNIKTDLSFDQMMDIQKHYKDAAKDISQIQIQEGSGTTIDRIYYYIIPEEEITRLQGELKEHMEI